MTALRRANAAREEEGRGEQEACVATAMIERLYSGASEALSTYDSMESVGKESLMEEGKSESLNEPEPEGEHPRSMPRSDGHGNIEPVAEPKSPVDFDSAFTYNGCTASPSELVRTLSDEDLCKLL